jgi:hypothetical protein
MTLVAPFAVAAPGLVASVGDWSAVVEMFEVDDGSSLGLRIGAEGGQN